MLPSRDVAPELVPTGTLAGETSINVLSVDAFLRAMSQEQGTKAVLQLPHFNPGQSTRWEPATLGRTSFWSSAAT